GEEPGLVGSRQRHRDQHDVRRNWKERAFGERNGAQDPRRMRFSGGVDAPIVKAAEHGWLLSGEWRDCPSAATALSRAGGFQRLLRARRPSRMTTWRRETSSGIFLGTFSAIPRSRSRRSISFQTSSGRILVATHSTTRL